ncbi:MAG: DUF1365 family protein [Candidatus Eremiobacteraeota bacterium]|nr:DUF1365 family protein [Candidatus Eremiobacteraeota bacterium]
MHHRLKPVDHRFTYATYVYAFEVEELDRLAGQLRWFGFNRPGVVSLYSRDYLDGSERPLLDKLHEILRAHGNPTRCSRAVLVTGARFLGHIFNPVSFWFCYQGEELACLVAEVNNTFGERHTYVLDEKLPAREGFCARFRVPKAFYVSPFNPIEGDYEFRVAHPEQELDIRLRIFDGEAPVFNTWLRGTAESLDGRGLWRTLTAYPLTAWLTVPRIHWEAAVLFFKKGLPVVYKPRPDHPSTIRAEPPSRLHRTTMAVIRGFLQKAARGRLRFDLPNGTIWDFGPGGFPEAEVRVLNWDFFLRLVWDGDVALGDGLLAGEWESSDLTAVVRFFIDNREPLDDRTVWATRVLGRGWGWLRQKMRRNSIAGSRRNIQAHYDLGNELYRRFLDPSMSYSCAFFAGADDDLQTAQLRKIDMLLDKARLDAETHLLEIGCGWGSLAIRAVQRFGCRVTGITLSEQQLAWGRQAVAEAGLSDRIELLLCDYRKLEGRYDRVISCEMLEAVGHENLPRYFGAVERLLRPEGLAVLQVITVPDFSYDEYRANQDWIQKEIFPGALCPSISALLQAARRSSQLVLEELQNIGPHYARTLREWRERFESAWPELQPLGYDERFRRAWRYYLSYCEAAFASRNLGDVQMVLSRPKNGLLLRENPPWL